MSDWDKIETQMHRDMEEGLFIDVDQDEFLQFKKEAAGRC